MRRLAQHALLGQRCGIVKRGAQMALGKSGGGRVRVGVEHGNAVAHGLGGHGKHAAELAAAEYAEHGGWKNGAGCCVHDVWRKEKGRLKTAG